MPRSSLPAGWTRGCPENQEQPQLHHVQPGCSPDDASELATSFHVEVDTFLFLHDSQGHALGVDVVDHYLRHLLWIRLEDPLAAQILGDPPTPATPRMRSLMMFSLSGV